MDFLFKRATLSLILYCQVKLGNHSKTLFTGTVVDHYSGSKTVEILFEKVTIAGIFLRVLRNYSKHFLQKTIRTTAPVQVRASQTSFY